MTVGPEHQCYCPPTPGSDLASSPRHAPGGSCGRVLVVSAAELSDQWKPPDDWESDIVLDSPTETSPVQFVGLLVVTVLVARFLASNLVYGLVGVVACVALFACALWFKSLKGGSSVIEVWPPGRPEEAVMIATLGPTSSQVLLARISGNPVPPASRTVRRPAT